MEGFLDPFEYCNNFRTLAIDIDSQEHIHFSWMGKPFGTDEGGWGSRVTYVSGYWNFQSATNSLAIDSTTYSFTI